MRFAFVLGVLVGIVAPFLRRCGKAGAMTLASGAAFLVVLAVLGVAHADPQEGLATIEANRRQYLFVLACEIPVLVFALLSLRQLKKAILAWMGNPLGVYRMPNNRCHLAGVFLALVGGGLKTY